MYIHVHVDVYVSMRDEKEGRKKQARSNKQGKATQHCTCTQGSALQLSGGQVNNMYIHVVVKQEQETTETLRGRRRHGLTVDSRPHTCGS